MINYNFFNSKQNPILKSPQINTPINNTQIPEIKNYTDNKDIIDPNNYVNKATIILLFQQINKALTIGDINDELYSDKFAGIIDTNEQVNDLFNQILDNGIKFDVGSKTLSVDTYNKYPNAFLSYTLPLSELGIFSFGFIFFIVMFGGL